MIEDLKNSLVLKKSSTRNTCFLRSFQKLLSIPHMLLKQKKHNSLYQSISGDPVF